MLDSILNSPLDIIVISCKYQLTRLYIWKNTNGKNYKTKNAERENKGKKNNEYNNEESKL